MKKRIIIITCAVLAIAAIVCLAPWPTRIDVTMQGAKVSADGQIITTGEFHLEGWKLDFLFLGDQIKLDTISLPGNADTISTGYFSPLSDFSDLDFSLVGWLAQTQSVEDLVALTFAVSNDCDAYLIKASGNLYIGSTDINYDPQRILTIFKVLVE